MSNEQRANNRAAWLPIGAGSSRASRVQYGRCVQVHQQVQYARDAPARNYSRFYRKRDRSTKMDRDRVGAIVAALDVVLIIIGIVVTFIDKHVSQVN